MTKRWQFAFLALLVTACGGSVDADEPAPVWPVSGCPPAFDLVNGKCTVREIFVAGGTFVMGRGYCPEAGVLKTPLDLTCPLADAPHSVTVAPFWVDATVRSSGPNLNDTKCPSGQIECADPYWYSARSADPTSLFPGDDGIPETEQDCQKFGKHHLDEAQWEFIATWGGTRTYPWGEHEPSCADANAGACKPRNPDAAEPDASKVASYPASPEGIYDLIGNFGEVPAPAPAQYGPGYTAVPIFDPPCIESGECEWNYKFAFPVRGGRAGGPAERFRGAFRGTREGTSEADESPVGGYYSYRCARPAE